VTQQSVCQKCGHQNPSTRVTCENCAYFLPPAPANTIACPKCGQRNTFNRSTCEKCFAFLENPDAVIKPVGEPNMLLFYVVACEFVALMNLFMVLTLGRGVANNLVIDLLIIALFGVLGTGLANLRRWAYQIAVFGLPVYAFLVVYAATRIGIYHSRIAEAVHICITLFLLEWFYRNRHYFQN
jgi:ribosomal protein L40E